MTTKNEALIERLVTDLAPSRRASPGRAGVALVLALVAYGGMLAVALGLRTDLAQALAGGGFALSLGLRLGAWAWFLRLAVLSGVPGRLRGKKGEVAAAAALYGAAALTSIWTASGDAAEAAGLGSLGLAALGWLGCGVLPLLLLSGVTARLAPAQFQLTAALLLATANAFGGTMYDLLNATDGTMVRVVLELAGVLAVALGTLPWSRLLRQLWHASAAGRSRVLRC